MRPPVATSWEDYNENWYSAQWYGKPVYYGFHDGLDLNLKTGGATDLGQPLYAITDGVISSVDINSGWGKHLHIKHTGAWGTCYSHYAHCDSIAVTAGDIVTEGMVVGTLGNSGDSTSPHLHFSIKKKPVGINTVARTLTDLHDGWWNPVEFFDKFGGTMAETITVNKSDWDRLYKASTLGDKLINLLGDTGNIADKSDQRINELGALPQQEYQRGYDEGKNSVPSVPDLDPSMWEVNGMTVETTEGNQKTILNYKRKP